MRRDDAYYKEKLAKYNEVANYTSPLIIINKKILEKAIDINNYKSFEISSILKTYMFPIFAPINKRTMRLVFNEGSRIGIFLFINSDIINAHGIMAMFSKVAIEFRSPEYLFFLANTNDPVVSQLCYNLQIKAKQLPRIEILKFGNIMAMSLLWRTEQCFLERRSITQDNSNSIYMTLIMIHHHQFISHALVGPIEKNASQIMCM